MPEAPSPKRRSRNPIEVFTVHPYGQADDERLRQLALQVMDHEGWSFKLRIIIADGAELRRLHRLFFGEDATTDVISFAGDEEDGAGEIYISLDQARKQALEGGEAVQRAIERLVVHGILHLGGWEDDSPAQRRRMLEHGEKYLSGD